ncbi:uncharacterized protein LOC132705585 [Cylas formicarius]|uniref:uncharacterized protein LOC132705585 n=1 Tax=Cylas formicarius TaxID=197179 RepID=UPI0029588078|nr:uncharacterized protein LOC132705585 [Cylas formicarius]
MFFITTEFVILSSLLILPSSLGDLGSGHENLFNIQHVKSKLFVDPDGKMVPSQQKAAKFAFLRTTLNYVEIFDPSTKKGFDVENGCSGRNVILFPLRVDADNQQFIYNGDKTISSKCNPAKVVAIDFNQHRLFLAEKNPNHLEMYQFDKIYAGFM